MPITKIDLTPVEVARAYATTTASLDGHANTGDGAGVARSTFVLLRLEDDRGSVGFGEVSDVPQDRLADLAQLQQVLEQRLVGQDPEQIALLTAPTGLDLDVRPDGTSYDLVSAAIDNALIDLAGRRVGLSSSALQGGRCREHVWVSWVAFIRGLDDLEAEIAAKIDEGFTAFKLKVGLDRTLDRERVRLVRQLAGDDAHLKLDANSAWTVPDAVEFLRSLEKWRPDGVETPVAYRDVAGKAELRRTTGVPVIEHVHDVRFAVELLRADAIDVINTSTVGAGGSWRARTILGLAEGFGLPCLLGSTVELGVGTAAQLHLAASSPSVTWPSDLVGPLLYQDDIIDTPLTWTSGSLSVPTGPGLGVDIDPDKVARLRTFVHDDQGGIG